MPIWRPASKPSDIARFFPGVSLSNQINIADWTAAGVVFCQELSCLRASSFEDIVFPRESMRVSRSGPGGKLLLLSDSFGAAAAAGLIEYFADIIMINMNNYQLLELDQRRALLEYLKSKWGTPKFWCWSKTETSACYPGLRSRCLRSRRHLLRVL